MANYQEIYQRILNDFGEGMHTNVTDIGQYAPTMFSIMLKDEMEFFKMVREMRKSSMYPIFTTGTTKKAGKDGVCYHGLIGLYETDAFHFRFMYDSAKTCSWDSKQVFNLLVKRIDDGKHND